MNFQLDFKSVHEEITTMIKVVLTVSVAQAQAHVAAWQQKQVETPDDINIKGHLEIAEAFLEFRQRLQAILYDE